MYGSDLHPFTWASATRAAEKPAWARDADVEALVAARKRRQELPIAQVRPTPTLR